MTKYLVGLALVTGTIVTTAQAAETIEHLKVDGFNTAEFEPFERTTTPTWTPTWEPTWTPEPQVTEAPVVTTAPSTYTSTYTEAALAGYLSEAEAASYLRAAGFPESVIPTMIYIGHRESGLCATAVYGYGCDGADHFYNGGPACSWLQLYECPGPAAMDPGVAAQYAYAKYKAAGYSLSPWSMTAP